MSARSLNQRTVRSFGARRAHFGQSRPSRKAKSETRFNKRLAASPWTAWRRPLLGWLPAVVVASFLLIFVSAPAASFGTTLHYAPNRNLGPDGTFLPAAAGFNLADVSSLPELDQLKQGDKALVWVGLCHGVDQDFLRIVGSYVGRSNLFGFFLMDDPDPRALANVQNPSHACDVKNLRAEADWIHDHLPGVRTVIVLMNMGTAAQPSFEGTYEPATSHIDLFGLAAYPCRAEVTGCDYDIIDRYVASAINAGIPRDHVVPTYQAFGEGDWVTDSGSRYSLPDANQEIAILSRWRQLVPDPEMDMAYSWGSQQGDLALESSVALQAVFARHNRAAVDKAQMPQ